MTEVATLRKLRASNAKLMKGNLDLLMSIREVDSKIHEEWRELQVYCAQLERNGKSIPPSCLSLISDQTEPTQAISEVEPNTAMDVTETDPSGSVQNGASKTGKPAPALSMRSVLNDDDFSSDDASKDGNSESGASVE